MYLHREYRAGRTIEVIETFPGNYGRDLTRENYKGGTPLAMERYNTKLKGRSLTHLLNTNFRPGDIFMTLHYSRDKRPTPTDAKKQLTAFLRRLRAVYRRYGLELKYIKVTAFGSKGGIHHHIVINSGVPYEEITRLWDYSARTPEYRPLYSDGEYSALAVYLIEQSKIGSTAEQKIKGKGYVGSRNLKQAELIKEEEVPRICWKEPPKPKKGYIIDPNSIDAGVNELNGKPYLFYRLLPDPLHLLNKNGSRDKPAERLKIWKQAAPYGCIVNKKPAARTTARRQALP